MQQMTTVCLVLYLTMTSKNLCFLDLRDGREKAIHMTAQLINQSIAITVPVAGSSRHVLSVLLLVVT